MPAYHICSECLRPLLTPEDINRAYHKVCKEEVDRRAQESIAHQTIMTTLL